MGTETAITSLLERKLQSSQLLNSVWWCHEGKPTLPAPAGPIIIAPNLLMVANVSSRKLSIYAGLGEQGAEGDGTKPHSSLLYAT